MNFSTDELRSVALDKLFNQKERNSFCDLTLIVNEKVVKAHRNVLAAASPYFESILKHHKVVREQLIVHCTDVSTFEAIINYMYTGRVCISHDNVEELLRLADHFLITKIIEYCIEFLGTKLNHENCLFTYYLTQRFKLKQLGSLVENWIDTNLTQICDGDEILGLQVQELQEFFKNKVFALPFMKLLKIVAAWALKHVAVREHDLNKLYASLAWSNADHNEVYKHLDTCELFAKSDLAAFYLLHCLMLNNMLSPNFQSKYDGLHAKYSQTLKSDEMHDDGKITVSEKDGNNMIIVKAKNRNRREQLLARLLSGLKPTLRSVAIKAIKKRNKKLKLLHYLTDNIESDSDEEGKSGIKCPICSVTINDSMLLEQHLALSHAKDVTYKCGICNFVCQYHGDYLNHMKTHFAGPPYRCDYCDFVGEQVGKLIAHRAKHLEDAVFQCTFCAFKCRSKPNYLTHLKMHSPAKCFKCEQCTKTFKHKHNLDAHLVTHSASEKPLTCESCGFHTKFLSHMIAHKRIHAGDMYRCSYPHCKYSTSKKNQLLSHAKTHNGVRPHCCTVCGRGFMEKSHLVRHERIHLEEKPFKCANCDYASSRRDKLKEHFTRHHGENASAKVPYKARPMRASSNAQRTNGKNAQPETANGALAASSNSNTNTNVASFTANGTNSHQSLNSDIQDLIMHHQNANGGPGNGNLSTLNTNYHHFTDPGDFHHHSQHIQHQILGSHNAAVRPGQHHNNVVNHHMLGRSNHSTATSTAAAVAAAMMLDPRFHHNSTVPYPSTTPVSMAAMAAVQSSQQIQASSQHSTEYSSTLQNCMTLF